MATTLVTFGVGLGGVALGGMLARRNDRRGRADRLLAEAFNDAVSAIAEVAGGAGNSAQQRYASATSRIALHASPKVVAAFRRFQNDAETVTPGGRGRLLAAVEEARRELGSGKVDNVDLAVLLFGDMTPLEAQQRESVPEW